MFLLWLRVAAVCYGVATLCALPAVLYNLRWLGQSLYRGLNHGLCLSFCVACRDAR